MSHNESSKTHSTISLPSDQPPSIADDPGIQQGWLHKTKKTIILEIKKMVKDFIEYAKNVEN